MAVQLPKERDLTVQFSHPALLLLLAVLPWLWHVGQAARNPVSRSALAWRSTIAILLVLSVSGLRIRVREGHLTVMFVLDRSDSISARAQTTALARVNEIAAAMQPGDRAGVVAFGADSALERRPAERLHIAAIASRVPSSATNIEAALRMARSALPPAGSRRIVLVSDGRETSGDAAREAAFAAAAGITIDSVPADESSDPRRRRPVVKSVSAPPDVRVGEPFLVSVEVEGPPGAQGRVTLYPDGHAPIARPTVVAASGLASVSFTDERREAGVYGYRAAFSADQETFDAGQEPPADEGAMVSVSGEPTVLSVSGSRGSLAVLLEGAGFRVREMTPESTPSSPNTLAAYDAVVLDDVSPERLEAAQAGALAHYVEQGGGGLLVLGSPRSLDPVGYPKGQLGRTLPIDLQPRSGQRAPTMGLVLVFDKSGSMADRADGVPKIELARQAVMNVVDVVPATDAFGVIAFDAAPADADRLRAAVRGRGVEFSVVAIGPDADRAFLQRLAQDTGGRAYFPQDARQLPLIVARDAMRSAGGRVVEEDFKVHSAPHAVLAGIDRATMPTLGGYVVSAARPGSEAILTSHLDDPVLAAWRFGLGKVAVFTADLASPWSAPLRAWKGFGPLWAQTIRWLSRRSTDSSLRATVTGTGDAPRVIVEAEDADGRFANGLEVRAVVRTPNGDQRELTLSPTAPGRYQTQILPAASGAYVMTMTARDPETGSERRAFRGFYWSAARERRALGVDLPTLGRLAEITGGRVLAPNDNPFTETRPAEYRDVWSFLATAALLIFLGDVAHRRGIGFPGWRAKEVLGKEAAA